MEPIETNLGCKHNPNLLKILLHTTNMNNIRIYHKEYDLEANGFEQDP